MDPDARGATGRGGHRLCRALIASVASLFIFSFLGELGCFFAALGLTALVFLAIKLLDPVFAKRRASSPGWWRCCRPKRLHPPTNPDDGASEVRLEAPLLKGRQPMEPFALRPFLPGDAEAGADHDLGKAGRARGCLRHAMPTEEHQLRALAALFRQRAELSGISAPVICPWLRGAARAKRPGQPGLFPAPGLARKGWVNRPARRCWRGLSPGAWPQPRRAPLWKRPICGGADPAGLPGAPGAGQFHRDDQGRPSEFEAGGHELTRARWEEMYPCA